jgi:hypothetical protein
MGDHMHLNREKAHGAFKLLLEKTGEEEETVSIELVKLMTNSQRWEDRFGALLTA